MMCQNMRISGQFGQVPQFGIPPVGGWPFVLVRQWNHGNVGIAIINHLFLMVYTTHLWWLGGWFLIDVPTLCQKKVIGPHPSTIRKSPFRIAFSLSCPPKKWDPIPKQRFDWRGILIWTGKEYCRKYLPSGRRLQKSVENHHTIHGFNYENSL